MAKENKYKGKGAENFFDYSEQRMSEKESNAFERQLQRDPFEEEAAEGMSKVTREEAMKDLDILSGRLSRRISRSRRITWYGAAAATATILIVTTIFLNLDKNKLDRFEPVPQLEKVIPEQDMDDSEKFTGETAEDFALEVPAGIEEQPEIQKPVQTVKEVLQVDDEEIPEIHEMQAMQGEQEIEISEEAGTERSGGGVPADKRKVSAYAAGNVSVQPEAIDVSFMNTGDEDVENVTKSEQGLRITQEDKQTQAAVSESAYRRAAREEAEAPVSVQALPIRKSETVGMNDIDSRNPVPLIGMDAYLEYIDSSLVFPPADPDIKEASVVLRFSIDPSGRPVNFDVIRTTGDAFSKEAIRAIEEGPDWYPAIQNGEYSDESVRIKIEFNEKTRR